MPKYSIENITKINSQQLLSNGIKGIIFDVDQTLTLPNSLYIYPPFLNSFYELSKYFKVCALTNQNLHFTHETSSKRIKFFESKYKLKVISTKPNKPAPSSFYMALNYLSLNNEQVIFIGDRILTDIIGSNLSNIISFHVNQIDVTQEPFLIKIIIKLELFVVKFIKKILH